MPHVVCGGGVLLCLHGPRHSWGSCRQPQLVADAHRAEDSACLMLVHVPGLAPTPCLHWQVKAQKKKRPG